MAVTVNLGGQNLRSDFMISDAAIPQMVAQNNDQFAKFEEMLTKVNEKLEKFSDIKKAFDEGKYDVPTVEELKAAGAIRVPESPREIAKKILSGKMKIDEIPSDVDMVEVLKELALLSKSTELRKSTDDESDEDEIFSELKELFGDEAAAELAVLMGKLAKKSEDDEEKDKVLDPNFLASLMSVDVSDEITDILSSLVGEDTDEVEAVGEVELADSELQSNDLPGMPQYETEAVFEAEEAVEASEQSVQSVGEIAAPEQTLLEDVNTAKAETVESTSVNEVGTVGVEASAVEITEVSESVTSDANAVEITEASPETVEITAPEAVEISANAVEITEASPETVEIIAPEAVENTANEVRTVEITAPEAVEISANAVEITEAGAAEAKAVEIIAPEAVENAANTVEITEAAGTEASANVKATEQSGEAAEVVQNAAENGVTSQKPEAKLRETEKVENSEQVKIPLKEEESVPVKVVDERSKALSEELEMLKNAKQKPESEPKAQDNSNKLPAMANSFTESAVILRKDSGEIIVVSQKEVASQVQQFVEQAITENREQTEYSLMLNPGELGRITVKLTKAADGAVSVTIVAENARTQRMLEQNSELMQSNLRNNGVNLENWQTVGESQQNHPAQDYKGSAKNPYFAQEDNSDEEQNEDGKSFADIIAAM